jgi:hypothetical protein
MALFLSNAIEKMVKYEYVIVAVLLFCSCGAKMHLVIDKAPKFSVHLTANCDTIAINDTLMMNIAIKNITDTIARIDSGTVVEVDSWTGVFDHREMLDCWVLYRFDEPIFLRPQESWFHKANLLITPIMESFIVSVADVDSHYHVTVFTNIYNHSFGFFDNLFSRSKNVL